jgi:pimeloyl-ACP methyl ester carboxylesterase
LSARPILVDAANLGRITAPTLISWGEQDTLFPHEEQERSAADDSQR